MPNPLRVLLIEDSADDAELVLRELRRGGYEPFWHRVDDAPALADALRTATWDLITCDYVMPRFSALAAMKMIRATAPDLPVIIVSGQVGEEVAVSAMKAGAQDYVSKHRLVRLVPAIERELAEACERRRVAATLRESNARYRALVESLHDVVFEIDADERLSYVSPSITALGGTAPEAYVGRSFRDFIYAEDLPAVMASLQRTLSGEHAPLTYRVVDAAGALRWVRSSTRPVFDDAGRWRALRGVLTDVTEQVEAEQAYRTVFEHSQQGLAVFEDGRIVLANAALAALTGIPLAALQGESVLTLTAALVHPDDRERMTAAARDYVDGRLHAPGFEFRILRRDGQTRHVITSHTDMQYRGRPARLVVYTDVTERTQADQAYRTLFEGTINGMLLVQGDRVVMANPAVEEMVGIPRPILLGEPIAALLDRVIPPADRETLRLYFERWLATGDVRRRHSLSIRRPDGSERHLFVQTAIASHQGAPAALIALADLTDRWRAEEAYRTVFERSLESLLVVSGHQVLMANQAAAELTGYAMDELTRLRTPELIERLVHPDDAAPLSAELATYLAGAAAQTRRLEYRLRRRDGEERLVLCSCAPMAFGGQPAVLVGHIDITDRWQAEAALRELNAALEARVAERTAALEATAHELQAFTYSASHDLRAPLRVIDGFCQALVEDFGDTLPEGAMALLQRVLSSAADMRELLDQLLVLSRVARGELRRAPVDLTALAREVAAELTRDATAPVVVDVQHGLRGEGDAALLRAALHNLLANAVKFSRPRPRPEIAVGARSEGAELVFFVRDNGVGFDPAHAGRLFQPFQRLHSTRDFGGHGIGLATVSRIVTRHGGRIWAESAVDRGATFYFTLG